MAEHPTLSIEAQIGEHMATVLTNDGFRYEIKWIQETDRSNLTGDEGTVCRTYLPEYAFEHSDKPRISIILFSSRHERVFRNKFMEDYFIDTVVHQRLTDPGTTKKTTTENVRSREEQWRQKITIFGDIVTKICEQVRITFEKRSNSGAAFIAPGDTQPNCATWLNAQRDVTFQHVDVNERHLVICVARHLWRTYRTVAER